MTTNNTTRPTMATVYVEGFRIPHIDPIDVTTTLPATKVNEALGEWRDIRAAYTSVTITIGNHWIQWGAEGISCDPACPVKRLVEANTFWPHVVSAFCHGCSVDANEQDRIDAAYVAAYDRTQSAVATIQEQIHDLPAPDGDFTLTDVHVAQMEAIAQNLEQLTLSK